MTINKLASGFTPILAFKDDADIILFVSIVFSLAAASLTYTPLYLHLLYRSVLPPSASLASIRKHGGTRPMAIVFIKSSVSQKLCSCSFCSMLMDMSSFTISDLSSFVQRWDLLPGVNGGVVRLNFYRYDIRSYFDRSVLYSFSCMAIVRITMMVCVPAPTFSIIMIHTLGSPATSIGCQVSFS
jgi:hypothetical protein